jgi:hypothetical protein
MPKPADQGPKFFAAFSVAEDGNLVVVGPCRLHELWREDIRNEVVQFPAPWARDAKPGGCTRLGPKSIVLCAIGGDHL